MGQCRIVIIFLIVLISWSSAQEYEWKVISRPSGSLTYVYFIDTLTGFAQDMGGNSGLRKTTNGGFTWGDPAKNVGWVKSLSMSDSLNGWAVASSSTLGLIHRTSDGGKTWITVREIFDEYYTSTISYSTQNNITGGKYQSGEHYFNDTTKILITSNGGNKWQERNTFGDSLRINKVYCLDSLRIYIYAGDGKNQYQLRSTNGGKTWNKTQVIISFPSLFFLDSLNGWAGTIGPPMYRTYNGGDTWLPIGDLTGDADAIGGITFIDSLHGWTFGQMFYDHDISESIHKTTDGGKTWQLESVGLCGGLGSGMMLDAKHGWAVDEWTGYVLAYLPKSLGVKKLPELPRGYALRQNYPNPFNPTTTIEYEIPQREFVTISVFDITGKTITTLVSQQQDAGVYQVEFGKKYIGLSSGTYIYEINAGSYHTSKQMMLIK